MPAPAFIPDAVPAFIPDDPTGASLVKKPAEMRAGEGTLGRVADVGEQVLGYGAGAVIGSAGGIPGAIAGGAIGGTTADIDIARRHGRADLTSGNVAKDLGANVAGAAAGEGLGAVGGKLLGRLGTIARGEPEYRAAAQQTFEQATAAQQGAVGKQAAKNLEERTAAYEKGQAAQRDFAAKRLDIERNTADQVAKAHEKIGEKASKQGVPESQQGMIASSLGRTPQETTAAMTHPPEPGTALPGPERVAQQQRFYQHISGPLKRASDAWAAKRDKLLGPFMDQGIDSLPLQNAVTQESLWAESNNRSFSPAVQKLFNKAMELEAPEPESVISAQGELPGGEAYNAKDFPGATKLDTAGGLKMLKPMPTVRAHLGLRSEASALAASATRPIDRHAANSIVDGIDETLAQINTPSLQPLNAQYRDFKTIFPRQFGRTLATTEEPKDFAPEIFDHPVRALHLIEGAKPDERQTLRDIYGDWVNRDGSGVIKADHKEILAKLYPGTPLGTPEGFTHITSKAQAVEDLLKTSPEAQQKFMQEFVPAERELVIKGMQQGTAEAIKQARKMGPLGQQIVQRIEAIHDPVQQYQTAVQAMTGTTPEQIMRATMATQKSSEAAGREAIMGMGLPQQTAGGQQISIPTSPEEAAIASLRAGKLPTSQYGPGRQGSWIMNHARRMWPMYLMIGGAGGMATGHISPWIGGMAIMGGASVAADRLFKQGFAKALENPEFAANFFRGVTSPAAPGAMKLMAGQAAKAAMADAVGGISKAATGTTLEKEPDNKPTDMTKEYDRTAAEKAVGAANPERVDHAIKVNKDLRKGKTPDVAGGLRTGRLSMPAVKRLLKMQSAKTAPALVQHLGPDDLKHMLALATPEEEAWLRPLVERRLGNG